MGLGDRAIAEDFKPRGNDLNTPQCRPAAIEPQVLEILHRTHAAEVLEARIQAAKAHACQLGQLLGTDWFVRMGLQVLLDPAHMAGEDGRTAGRLRPAGVVRLHRQQGRHDELLDLRSEELVVHEVDVLRGTVEQIGHQATPR